MLFNSLEEAFQYQKAMEHGKIDIAETILREKSGPKAYEVGKTIQSNSSWLKKERKLMKDLVVLKYKTCKEFQLALDDCVGKEIIEDTPSQKWGRGTAIAPGRNEMGKILSEVLQEMKTGSAGEYEDPPEGHEDGHHVSGKTTKKQGFQKQEKHGYNDRRQYGQGYKKNWNGWNRNYYWDNGYHY